VTTTAVHQRGQMAELATYFLRLGFLGFGGPVALVGQMERELVNDKKWLSKDQMREAIAICQSLPGPLAIQVGIYIAWLRCGFWGAWLGGWCFILPNFVIVAALGALYVYLGDLKPVTAIFYGVSPAVIALILHSCYRLAKLGMEDWLQWAIAAVCLVVTVILQAEVALLFIGAGIIGILYYGSLFKRTPAIMPVVAVGIFLPSFLLVLIVAPILARHRENTNVQGFVKGAYGAAIGTILGACILLGKIAIGDWLTIAIGALSLIVLFRWKVSNPALIAVTAVVGLIAYPILQPAWVMVH